MVLKIILYFFMGLIGGFLLEFSYRSIKNKKIIIPKFVNAQMYGLTGAFLILIYSLEISLALELLLIFVFPTIVEFITGYLYLKIDGIYLWDYSKEKYSFKRLICPLFSLYWFIVGATCYYLLIPLFN